MKQEFCEHRYDITFSFTVTGFGDTEAEAIDEARYYAVKSWIDHHSVEAFEVSKIVKDRHIILCGLCEEEE